MKGRYRHRHREDAELNITAFMNLMIVLVPVLLMTMVFSQITVLELTLPDAASSSDTPELDKQLELVVEEDQLSVYYPRGFLLKRIPNKTVEPEDDNGVGQSSVRQSKETDYDYELLTNVLQEAKRLIRETGEREAAEKGVEYKEKRNITILSQPDTDYQTIVSLMDASRSFKAVVAGSVVDAELFPEISLGDAPVTPDKVASQ